MRFARNDSGGVIVLFALTLAVSAGLGAFALDLPHGYTVQGRLQNAADAGALAAAQKMHEEPEQVKSAGAQMAMNNVASHDGTVTTQSDVELGIYDDQAKTFTPSGSNYNAVRVRAVRSTSRGNAVPVFLAGIFGQESMDVAAEAIAAYVGPSICMFALSDSAVSAFRAGGGGKVNVPNCGIQVNSTSAEAMTTQGGQALISSQKNCVAGGWSGNITPPPTACDLLPDPLAALPEPNPPGGPCDEPGNISNSETLPPGKYCGTIKVTGSATVTLDGGLNGGIYHFVDGATLELHNSSSLVAHNAMLYFDETSTIKMSSNGSFEINPIESGTYRGIAMFGSRKGSTITEARIGGGYHLHVPGAIYMPKTDVRMQGGSSLLLESGYIIANTYRFQGSSEALITMNPGLSPTNLSGRAMLVR